MGLISLVMMGISGITHAVRAANPNSAQTPDNAGTAATTAPAQSAQEKQRLATQDAGGKSFAQHYQARIAKAVDTDHDGFVSRAELEKQVKAGGGTAEQAGALYKSMDKNGDGKVSVAEFKNGIPVPKSNLVQHLRHAREAQAAKGGTASGHAGQVPPIDASQILAQLAAQMPKA